MSVGYMPCAPGDQCPVRRVPRDPHRELCEEVEHDVDAVCVGDERRGHGNLRAASNMSGIRSCYASVREAN